MIGKLRKIFNNRGSKKDEKVVPSKTMFEQYIEFKQNNLDSIIFIQDGVKYFTYELDANLVHNVVENISVDRIDNYLSFDKLDAHEVVNNIVNGGYKLLIVNEFYENNLEITRKIQYIIKNNDDVISIFGQQKNNLEDYNISNTIVDNHVKTLENSITEKDLILNDNITGIALNSNNLYENDLHSSKNAIKKRYDNLESINNITEKLETIEKLTPIEKENLIYSDKFINEINEKIIYLSYSDAYRIVKLAYPNDIVLIQHGNCFNAYDNDAYYLENLVNKKVRKVKAFKQDCVPRINIGSQKIVNCVKKSSNNGKKCIIIKQYKHSESEMKRKITDVIIDKSSSEKFTIDNLFLKLNLEGPKVATKKNNESYLMGESDKLRLENLDIAKTFSSYSEAYKSIKEKFPNHMILFSEGFMYGVYYEDAIELNKSFGYKILYGRKAGFSKKGGFEKVANKYSVVVLGKNYRINNIFTLNEYKPTLETSTPVPKNEVKYLEPLNNFYIEKNNCLKCFKDKKRYCDLHDCPNESLKYYRDLLFEECSELIYLPNSCVVVLPDTNGNKNIALEILAKNTFRESEVLADLFDGLILYNNLKGLEREIYIQDKIASYKMDEDKYWKLFKYQNIIVMDGMIQTGATLSGIREYIIDKVGEKVNIEIIALEGK